MAEGRYAHLHASPQGPGDARPTAAQIITDDSLTGALKDKVILVTGGSSGLGVDIVRQLAKTGAKVFFTSRDMGRGEKVRDMLIKEAEEEGRDSDVEVLEMELGSLDSVRTAAAEFKERSGGRMNVLVSNAGIGLAPEGRTKDGWETHFGVNHLAHFLLFQLLEPLLLESSTPEFQSRVISVASSIHTFGPCHVGDYNLETLEGGYTPFAAYAHSKTANIWFANELDRRYASRGIHALSVHPGGITETNFSAHHDPAVVEMMSGYLQQPHIKNALKSTAQGAAPIVQAAVGKEFEGVGGFYLEDCGRSPPLPEDAPLGTPGYKPWAYDEEKEGRLWDDSLKMVGLAEK